MKTTELVLKANSVIASCRTPAQLRVAHTYAHRALGTIGALSGDRVYRECHFGFMRLLRAKARQLNLKHLHF